MFFILSKTAVFLATPSDLLIILGLAGLFLFVLKRNRVGISLASASILALAAVANFPVGNFLGYVLESRFPPWDAGNGAPAGIVVLGGAISSRLSRAHGETVVDGDAGRIFALMKLARAYPTMRVIYSGGDGSLLADETPEADYVYPLLETLGIGRERVLIENRSRNTVENAVFSKQLANPKPGERWLLVTSAMHMPRAIGCFRKAGFPVEAYPVAWRTMEPFDFRSDQTMGGAIKRLDAAAHEWIGLIAYRVTGKTAQLLPSP